MISKATETSAVTRRENPAELLKTLFTIVSGIPRDTEVTPKDTMKRRDPPVNIDRSDDDHQKYKYVFFLKKFFFDFSQFL